MIYIISHMAAETGSMGRMVDLCRRRGIPVTAQRRAVLRALAGRRDHPTAEQVHAAASARLPGMTLATVYRVLGTLERLGVARRVAHAGTGARFEVDSGAHHHLVCTSCGRILDLRDPAPEALSIPAPRASGFSIQEITIQFRGLCRACRRRRSAHERRRR
jgi:Fur family peroxide stress response transcriptional regulator